MQRTELVASVSNDFGSASVQYTNLSARPGYNFSTKREEIGGSVTLKIADNFTLNATAKYDLKENNLYQHTISMAYDDDCFHYGLNYSNTNPLRGDEVHTVGFSIKLRTIGDFDFAQTLENDP